MSTTHEQAVINKVDELMLDADWAQMLAQTLKRLKENFYGFDYVSAIFQNFERAGKVSIYDAYAFLMIHSDIHLGRVLIRCVNLNATPGGDSAQKNSDVIARIKSPFRGAFDGGPGDQDGYIAWKTPVIFQRHACAHLKEIVNQCPTESVTIGPSNVPLEVGYTKASRTLMHLRGDRGVARWAYGSKYLWIFYAENKSYALPSVSYVPRAHAKKIIQLALL